jgi:hypothetical protein
VASGGVQTNKTKESVVEFQKELNLIAGQKVVSEKELADARNNRFADMPSSSSLWAAWEDRWRSFGQ